MDVSKNGGTKEPWVFLLNMIIFGCFGGTPISGNTHIHPRNLWKVNIDTQKLSKNNGLQNVSPVRYGYSGCICQFSRVQIACEAMKYSDMTIQKTTLLR